ncbi:ferrochelatase [Rhodospirillum rubrum]|uniref:Ferrochelatase n=1 Tax=Rhodospirillum rubrum (strain ATCC 11170 / ATH 1.1.1 / DSM 467 / LMG 4362 / NCIMB 8255 / S1) TaxID=269796 RepID=Q2RN84_RHORT|nr:ferrochelatase [Rhodospirillum rubrum]ABC24411.1 Ferrochelatase [Rhodospirillum rubrum ATCC 11170]AEO50162.1 ferrochelatase [Rhodospirillum rubrum F11]MBK1663223.1 ferrochelatase [Rhodospirillum rubrum]MBK1676948.1 ferrochelatase [Rhodospirillum rubrum]MBK5956131.1 ferrochelatase [Rhodospirillum rubrum]
MARIAVVLFNLGGPDSPEAVRPFLFNLFNDPAIIEGPSLTRWVLARLISWRRAPIAREIYGHLGGRSPLLEQTEGQARALEKALSERGHDARCLIAMRYWKPLTREAVKAAKAWNPDQVVLLPLYPQFSGTTSGSSLNQWTVEAEKAGLTAQTHTVCCYATEVGLITALAERTLGGLEQVRESTVGLPAPRVLFSAHGLPRKVVDAGDPYQSHVEATVNAVVAAMAVEGLDYQVCYQSRVGPLEWIGPSTEDEIAKAGREGRPLVVVPVAFVSEHSETLVELDIEYGELAEERGVPKYVRVPTVREHPAFIGGLAGLVERAMRSDGRPCSHLNRRVCEGRWGRCLHLSSRKAEAQSRGGDTK